MFEYIMYFEYSIIYIKIQDVLKKLNLEVVRITRQLGILL